MGVPVKQHNHFKTIVKELRGSRRTALAGFVTHIIVGSDLSPDEKLRIATHRAVQGAICKVVTSGWLTACKQVRSSPAG